ncbi:hypothetical protein B0T21DRAFT_354283 [Apiosordaria backusii]|uniref:Myb-like domain-containing protein n=1 Tax=Apiosordaria backusii TaxID=314023 RepID=A0AA40EY14_9PEZI|nr:hypothetical protein B0T21DRAFT_354283 [Apiosordaria backusii]
MLRPRGLRPPTRSAELPPDMPVEPTSSRGWNTDGQVSYHGESSHAPQPTTSQEPSWQYSLQSIMAPPVSYDNRVPHVSRTPDNNDGPEPMGGDKNRDKDGDGDRNLPPEVEIVIPEYPHSAYNYGTWSAADDRTLVLARSRGKHWLELQQTYFPTKTANACRKRYERLMERRGAFDQDSQRLERISHEYMALRKQMWTPLADRVGESWEVVEAACMSAGIRTIQSNARSHTNRWRRESRASQKGREGPLPLQHDLNNMGPSLLPPGMGPSGRTEDFEPLYSPQGSLSGGIFSDSSQTMFTQPQRDAELMPPPPFPPSGSGPPPPGGVTTPSIPFAGYLHVRSTRRPVVARTHSEGRNPAGELGWQTTNPLKPG